MPSYHESTDASAIKIMWVMLVSIVASIIMFLSLASVFSLLKSDVEHKMANKVPEKLIAERKGPPPPLLEVNPLAEITAQNAREKELLKSYEWLDREKGIVRIPIKKAIEILLYEH